MKAGTPLSARLQWDVQARSCDSVFESALISDQEIGRQDVLIDVIPDSVSVQV